MGSQPNLTAVNPWPANRLARSPVSAGVAPKRLLAYGRSDRVNPPPSSFQTGSPSALPLISHKARSIPLIAWMAMPLRPL